MTITLNINAALVQRLIAEQFPQWSDLPVSQILPGGWDNRMFRLGAHWVVRLPRHADYAPQVEKELRWLPPLSRVLPFTIPQPVGHGKACEAFPLPWSVLRWIDADCVATEAAFATPKFARSLAQALLALQSADATDGPPPGAHCFWRGDALHRYESEVMEALRRLDGQIDGARAMAIWRDAPATSWTQSPVWVHGDVHPGNILLHDGELHALLDFGNLCVGDPACDLVMTWTTFHGDSRRAFIEAMQHDENTWQRARAWALWKALILASKLVDGSEREKAAARTTLESVLERD